MENGGASSNINCGAAPRGATRGAQESVDRSELLLTGGSKTEFINQVTVIMDIRVDEEAGAMKVVLLVTWGIGFSVEDISSRYW